MERPRARHACAGTRGRLCGSLADEDDGHGEQRGEEEAARSPVEFPREEGESEDDAEHDSDCLHDDASPASDALEQPQEPARNGAARGIEDGSLYRDIGELALRFGDVRFWRGASAHDEQHGVEHLREYRAVVGGQH